MKFPTMEEWAESVAEMLLDEYEYKGKTLRQWIEIIYNAEHGTNLAEVGTDCISRQAALNEFCHSCDGWSCNPNTCCKTEWIRKLPPIQPKMGRWEYIKEHGQYECSECGEPTDNLVMGKPRANFCPNCGSYNGGEQDDSF